jgi:tape measure domain-containing protein
MARVAVRFDGVSTGAKKAAAETRGAIKGVRQEAGLTDKAVGRLGSSLKSALVIGTKAGALGVGALAGSVAFAGFKFDDLRQRSQIAFATMLQSGTKAKSFLDDLAKFAAKTPFEFPDLIRSSQRLLAMGVAANKIIPVMTDVGNAVAAMGGDPQAMEATVRAIGQVQAKGRLMAEEMLQLNEAGTFSWRGLAREIGTSVPKAMELVTKGAVTSAAFLEAFQRNSQRRFAGMMEQQSHTFAGLWSTIKDTFAQISGKVMQPFFDLTTRGFQKLVDITSTPEFTAGVDRFAASLQKKVGGAARDVVDFFRDNWGQIKDDLFSLGTTAKNVAKDVKAVATAAHNVATAIGGWDNVIKVALAAAVVSKVSAFAASLAAAKGSATGLSVAMTSLSKLGAIALAVDLSRGGDSLAWKIVSGAFNAGQSSADFVGLDGQLGVQGRAGGGGATGVQTSLTDKTRRWLSSPGVHFLSGNGGSVQVIGPAGDVFHTFSAGDNSLLANAARERARMGVEVQRSEAEQSAVGMSVAGASGATRKVLSYAAKYGAGSGITYTWGGVSPQTGFDCSGFIYAAYKAAGVSIPRTSDTQFYDEHAEDTTGREEAGDGVYFQGSNSGANAGRPPRHCGIYIGNDRYVEYFSGGQPAKVATLSQASGYMGARRWVKIVSKADAGVDPLSPSDAPIKLGAGKGATKKVAIPTGSKLLPIDVRTAIARAARTARTSDDLTAYEDAADNLRGQLRKKGLGGKQRLAIEEELSTIQKKINSIKTNQYEDKMKAIAAATKKRLAEARKAVEEARQAFEQAYGRLAERALDAFDRETKKRLDKVDDDLKARLAGIESGRATLTPEEVALAAFQASRQAADDARRRAELSAAVGAAETPEERAKALEDQAQFELDLEERTLREAADTARKAVDDRAQADQQAAQDAAETLRQQVQDERAIERQNFQDRLDDLEVFLADRHGSVAGANELLLGLMEEFGLKPEWFTSGRGAGEAWVKGLTAAMGEVQAKVTDLGSAAEGLQVSIDTGAGGVVSVDSDYAEAHGLTPQAYAAQSGRYNALANYYKNLPRRARGGKLPGQYVGAEDMTLYRGTPGETVIDRRLTDALEAVFVRGGGMAQAGDVYLDGQKVGRIIAQPVQSEQARSISYRSSRA